VTNAKAFSYREAISRNIGWVTTQEQEILRNKRVAIAGLGGVGGVHLLTLARLGIGAFHIADFDVFDLVNFNRQVGATISSLGQNKVDVLTAMARDINPELDIQIFPEGINEENFPHFFRDVDIYVDGLDFFAFPARTATFAACGELGIPAITAAPLGMGAALLNFLPGGMTFEDYFQWGNLPEEEKALRFLIGLAPSGLHTAYLMDPSTIDLAQRRGPSTIIGCQLCAATAAAEALKILLNRGRVLAAPHGMHVDVYRNKLVHTWRPGGNRNPLQRLALSVARKRLNKKGSKGSTALKKPEKDAQQEFAPIAPQKTAQDTCSYNVLEQLLDLARWAPSGDNSQPWRFQLLDKNHVIVHGFDTRDHCVYDLDGRPSQISIGALLETMSIAATGHGLRMQTRRRTDSDETKPTFDIHFEPDLNIQPDPLIPYIPYRSVQRRRLDTRPLTTREKSALRDTLPHEYEILWFESFSERLRVSRFMFQNAKLRLTMPEAYEVHRAIIQWDSQYSEDRIPDKALGIDPVTTRLMRWVMQSWERVDFFNTFLAGTWAPRIQMDLIPSIACSAHFVIVAKDQPQSVEDYVKAGRAAQRFWLTAARNGLQVQPEMTPLIFYRYTREGISFSKKEECLRLGYTLATKFAGLVGEEVAARAVFMGRIGSGRGPTSRSTRLKLEQLLWQS
jgi:molybdopterin/thiamine biosynthesis adenylyltransferase